MPRPSRFPAPAIAHSLTVAHSLTIARNLAIAAAVATALVATSLAAWAMGGSSSSDSGKAAAPLSADYAAGKAAVDRQDWPAAIAALKQAVVAEPRNAEAFNLLGYATRKSGDAQGSLQYYQQALAIDPKHLGAHEYIGEAYLMLGDLPRAEEHLARLDDLCTFGCPEYRELKEAIAVYKRTGKPRS